MHCTKLRNCNATVTESKRPIHIQFDGTKYGW